MYYGLALGHGMSYLSCGLVLVGKVAQFRDLIVVLVLLIVAIVACSGVVSSVDVPICYVQNVYDLLLVIRDIRLSIVVGFLD